jgi:hypothetical protein
MTTTALPVQTDQELAGDLANRMTGWLTGPPEKDPTQADLIEWCRSARDVLARVSLGGDGLAPDCDSDCGCHGTSDD